MPRFARLVGEPLSALMSAAEPACCATVNDLRANLETCQGIFKEMTEDKVKQILTMATTLQR